ncbi:hypothetical protein EV699_11816 [Plasticicumulans lactativorans]|uniref:Uncharacterized protein n=1 Tax=Plasticicumulans lactativorans TaxID=1133106 RepID=A0A4R2L1X9_9GAMM|nr:hypothetical protein [Plasticicumulans lactativorans]TCO79632.1 hypothetical protein EV699_11816 [Plasticicumulans lactativorans]
MTAETPSLIADLAACRQIVEDYVKRLDAACEEYYATGKYLFPSLSRAEDEDVDERCIRALNKLAAIEPDALARWRDIPYPSNQYDQQIERLRDIWVRRRNLLRVLESSLSSRFELQPRKDKGAETVTNYHITIHDVVGPVNVLSSLDGVIQAVRNAPSLSNDGKDRLAALIEELKSSLANAPDAHAEDATVVSEQAQSIADELSKPAPRPSALKIKASGLIEAAKAMEVVVPAALTVAKKIAAFVANPMS